MNGKSRGFLNHMKSRGYETYGKLFLTTSLKEAPTKLEGKETLTKDNTMLVKGGANTFISNS